MNQAPSRLESWSFYLLLATVVLAPLAFWASAYAPLDISKAVVISAGTLVAAILLGILAMKERKTATMPRPIFWTGLLLCVELALSALLSGHAAKSFFGQGFEVGTASFILVLFLNACVVFKLVRRDLGRALVLYAGLTASFFILYIFQLLRILFGANFASLGILDGVASTVFGSWYGLAAYALAIAVIAVTALLFLPLSRKMRTFYWVILVLSAFGALVVNDVRVWAVAALLFLGLAIFVSVRKNPREGSAGFSKFLSRIAWLPVIAFIVAALLTWKGSAIANPVAAKLGASYAEAPSLSWQGTLDVGAGTIKGSPLFGIGPNRFTEAYLANKPSDVNATDAWGLEFSSGWSTLSTFVVTQGLLGTVLWTLLFIFFGIAGARALRRLPEDPQSRFIIVSSCASAVFLWLMAAVSVFPHALLLLAFIFSAIFLASATVAGSLRAFEIDTTQWKRFSKLAPAAALVGVLVLIAWTLVYAKDAVAFSYFASGLKQLTAASPAGGDPVKADTDFASANKWNMSDVYLQARAEAGIAEASDVIAGLNAQSPASASQAVVGQAAKVLDDSLGYALAAIKLDPTNYYNYVSEARVASAGARLQIPNAYAEAVQAYNSAIALNPSNPSLYLSLAQLQAANNKLSDALQSVGGAIRVKGNYTDAVFLLSQIEDAMGNLPDAITAAQFAAGLNPQSPIVFFQLGLLEYENKNYQVAAQAFAQAIKLEPDYANAQYFLGLSYARLGNNAAAIAQFQSLTASNPDNQEVALILANLKAGKSPFNDAPASVATAPEKRSSLPIKQK